MKSLPPAETCDYCGLPLPARRGNSVASGPQYCCFGCRFAAEVTAQRGEAGEANWTLVRLGLAIFCTMNVAMFTMVLWTEDLYPQEMAQGGALATSLAGLLRYLCLLAALPVAFLLGLPLAQNAWSDFRAGRFSTDLLLTLGVGGAFAYSSVSVVRGTGHIYFEVGCVVLVLLTVGRWLEATGRIRASGELDALGQLLPEQVRWVGSTEQAEQVARDIPLEAVRPGDLLRVLPGERIPTDGWLRGSATAVDEQILTGESRPVVKEPGEALLGGTLNLEGDMLLEVTASPSAGALPRLIDAVRQARGIQGHYERLANRMAGLFVPLIITTAVGAAIYHGWQTGVEAGWMVGLAVLLIACPCALGLATPMAVWTALGRAARARVLFRDGEALERLAGVRVVCFDKTGTLTHGSHQLDRFWTDGEADAGQAIASAMSLATLSGHPLARALVDSYPSYRDRMVASQVEVVPGRGIVARDGFSGDSDPIWLGSPRWMRELDLHCEENLARHIEATLTAGLPLTCVAWQGRVRGVFSFRERVRPEAAEAVERCRALGLEVVVLTGDHQARGAELGRLLGVNVRAEMLPEDKLAVVAKLRDRHGPVAMVGDGINDAPALAASDVGITLSSAADLSRDSGQVCLLSDDLLRLPWAIELSRLTLAVIRENLLWAFSYNAIGVAMAVAGRLNPIVASLLMVASSALVVGNSLRIGRMPDTTKSQESLAYPPRPRTPRVEPQLAELVS